MAKQKHYVVWEGRETGVFSSWSKVQELVNGFKGAKFKSYSSKNEAEKMYALGCEKAMKAASSSKKSAKSKSSKSGSNHIETNINIYCDGSAVPNPGATGTGVCVYKDSKLTGMYYGGHIEDGTNNTAEIEGLLFSLQLIYKFNKDQTPMSIHVDSQYTINAVTKWAKGWKKRGWKKADGKPVKNQELIERTLELYESMKSFVFVKKVKAHVGIEGNEIADRLSNLARINKVTKFEKYKGDPQELLSMDFESF